MRAGGKRRLLEGQIRMLREKTSIMENEASKGLKPLQNDLNRFLNEAHEKRKTLENERNAFNILKEKNDKFVKNQVSNERICEQEAELNRLERELAVVEAAHNDAQNRLDVAQREQAYSMKFLIDPLNERMASTQQLLDNLDNISDRMRDQGKADLETLHKRDELLRKVQVTGDRSDLIEGYVNAQNDFRGLTSKISKEVRDI